MAERNASGQFVAGHHKIPGAGAKKGQKHRSTEMVNRLFDFYESEEVRQSLVRAWANLEPKEKWDVYTKCLKHMVPSVSSISFGDDKEVSSIQQLILNMASYRKENK